MQPGKNIKIFINYFLGPLLFVWLSYSIFRQIRDQPQLMESWLRISRSFESDRIFYLAAALCLVPVNWGLEAWKWKLSVDRVYPVNFRQAFMAVLSGISFSVTMPNRVGEYLGRMMFLPEGHRLKTISVSLVGSLAQLLVTLITGTVSLLISEDLLQRHFHSFRISFQFIVYGLVALDLAMLLIYFNVAGGVGLFRRWIKSQKYLYLVQALQYFDNHLLLRLLFLSLLRFAVFILQYILLFYFFGVFVPASELIPVMGIVFLALAIIPSIVLIEVWLRGEILILLVGMYSSNTLGIGFTSVTAWFVNLILPAIAGSLLILNLRAFRKRGGKS
jgi:hypothetical protein